MDESSCLRVHCSEITLSSPLNNRLFDDNDEEEEEEDARTRE